MIIGGFTVGVRILLEKGPSKHHILKIRKIPEKYQKIIFYQETEEAGRRRRESPLAHFYHRPFVYFIVPENLSQRGGSEIDTAASVGRKTPEREKLSGRQKSAGEIPSRRGDAVTQHTTACCSTQVVDITLMKLHFTNITSLRVVQQKHCGSTYKLLLLQAK
jgi:hypothetical protein